MGYVEFLSAVGGTSRMRPISCSSWLRHGNVGKTCWRSWSAVPLEGWTCQILQMWYVVFWRLSLHSAGWLKCLGFCCPCCPGEWTWASCGLSSSQGCNGDLATIVACMQPMQYGWEDGGLSLYWPIALLYFWCVLGVRHFPLQVSCKFLASS